jgi:hypothetical protein
LRAEAQARQEAEQRQAALDARNAELLREIARLKGEHPA